MLALDGERRVPLGAPKQRALLATLLVHAGEVLTRDRLIDALWGDEPPASAAQSLQVYVHGLRKALGAGRIETHGTGYRLSLEHGELDLERFRRLVAQARVSLTAENAADAADDLRRALGLWTGPPLVDLAGEPISETETGRLNDERLAAIELRNDAELALGRHDALLGELEKLLAEEPFRERLHEQYILALYRAGRQKDALDAYRAARHLLVDELGLEPGSTLQELERGILRHDPVLAAPEQVRAGVRPLPKPPTPLVGRRLEIAAVTALLHREDVRLVTLTGPGGTGKTRLGLAVAEELSTEFRDGVVFVDLAPVADPALLATTIAVALEVEEGDRSAADALADHLRDRSILLLVDNFEHLLQGAPLVSELLAAAPRLAVLATSRAPLRLRGEHEYSVPPLDPPSRGAGPTFEELAANDAVHLFVTRVRGVDPAFELTEQSAQDVAEICWRLDGLPLAIELAAARGKLLPPQRMVQRLEQALDVLTGGARDLPSRQRTLRATLDWSYALLSAPERVLLARLAVFSGGCTIDAVESVCADDGTDLLAIFTSLVDGSLLRSVADGRFAMLETIREYALEHLERSGESDELRRRHAEYFVELAETAERDVGVVDETTMHEQLEREHDNLRAVLFWSQLVSAPNVELRLAAALGRFWLIRGHIGEGRGWLEDALHRDRGDEPAARVKALRGVGVLALKQRDLEQAESFLEESLALARELGDEPGMARATLSLAVIAVSNSDYERAARLNEETIELARAADERRVLSTAINNLGDLALHRGRYDDAAYWTSEAVALARELRHREGLTLALLNLGQACLHMGRQDEASASFEEAFALARELGYQEALAYALEGLAALLAARGEPVRAARMVGAAELLLEKLGASLDRAAQELHERTLDLARVDLSEELLAAHLREGRSLDVDSFWNTLG
ncbi:MAG TPA: BTAD domain-containing putative transcriptional regulator [Gaiellaceae bacterium]